jgi:hypothetical protein
MIFVRTAGSNKNHRALRGGPAQDAMAKRPLTLLVSGRKSLFYEQ